MKQTKVFNGMTFSESTPQEVMNILSNASRLNRFRFWFGDAATGKCWEEEYDVCGYIGRSTGTSKIPLLIARINSDGGPGILDDCILKVVRTETKKVLYQHPLFVQPNFEAKGVEIFSDGQYWGKNSTEKSAQRLCDFMNGKRMCK